MISFSAPLQGMQAAETQVNVAAARIAKSAEGPTGDGVDLSSEAVALLDARNAFAANVKVAKTTDEMARTLFNVLG